MKKKIPEPTVPKSFQSGLYNPDFIPDSINVADFIYSDLEEPVVNKIPIKPTLDAVPNVHGVPVPLTPEESILISQKIDDTVARIRSTRERIAGIRKEIHAAVQPKESVSGAEFSFTMDISKKPRIRRAIKKLFGIKTDTITYDMYLDMLKAKSALQKMEVQGYLAGEDDEEED